MTSHFHRLIAITLIGLAGTVAADCGSSSGTAAPTTTSSAASTTVAPSPGEAQTQPYKDGYTFGSTWTTSSPIKWSGNIDVTCLNEDESQGLNNPDTDNATHSNEWSDGCAAGFQANPNRPN